MHARWEPADFAELARRLAWSPPFPLSGSTSIQVDAGGTRDDLKNSHVVAAIDRLHADADNQPIDLARPARLEYDGRVARVRDLALTTAGSTLTIEGSLGDRSQPGLTAQLRGLLSDFAFVQRLYQPGNPAAALTGAVDLRLDASGSLEHPDLSGSIRVTDGSVPVIKDLAFSGAVLTANYSTGVLTIEQLRAAFQGAAVEASGRIPAGLFRNQLPPRWSDLIPAAAGPARLNARVTSITEQVAAPFADASTLEQLRGHIDASIALQADDGTLESLNGAVTLDRAELSVSGVSFDQQAPTGLIVRGGRLEVASWEWGRGDNRVVLAGGLRLGDNQALDLTARTSLDLRLLTPFTGMARPAGRADAEIRIGGTTADPTVDGFVTFAGGELRLADPRIVVSDLSGTVTLARDTITLERIWASMNGGDAEISGTVHHRWFTPGAGSLSVRLRHGAFDLSGLRAEADADLTLALEPRGQLLSGTVTLARSTYREPLSLTGGLLQALRSSAASATSGSPSPLDTLRLDVRVVTGSDLLVDNNYARLAASANLRVGGTAAQPVPIGSITLGEGGLVFLATRPSWNRMFISPRRDACDRSKSRWS